MLLRERTLTVDEFLKLANTPEYAGKRVELVDGEIVEMPPSRRINTVIAILIAHYLVSFVQPRRLGYVSGADSGYITGERHYRQPDVGYISLERAGGLDGVTFDVAPDLAVKVVSPEEDVYTKALEYLRAGTRMVWAVYPDDRTIHVMTLDVDGALRSQVFGVDASLDGGVVLPGFSMAVQDVFPT